MNLVIAANSGVDPSILDLIKPKDVFLSTNPNKLLALAELSLQIDSKIFLEEQPIDWVLFLVDSNHRFYDFERMLPYTETGTDSWYSTNRYSGNKNSTDLYRIVNGNFYCSPKVFSLLANAYKIDPELDAFVNFREKCHNGSDYNFIAMSYLLIRTNIAVRSIA